MDKVDFNMLFNEGTLETPKTKESYPGRLMSMICYQQGFNIN